jgi:3',5'-cyclic AMP phosphodiesterase CpdA
MILSPGMSVLRIAHFSDPHFASITYHPNQFFSKRWLGNMNLLFFRSKTLRTRQLLDLPELFISLGIDFVAITGDLTTTSLDEEYKQAKVFVDSFIAQGMVTAVLPGNHDIYTKESERAQRFYQYFPSSAVKDKVEVRKIKEGFWWIGLHCAYASNLFLSNGKFTSSMEVSLKNTLDTIPREDCVIIGNHFPLFSTGNMRHDLMGAKKLQEIVKKYPNIKLYLHGHDHVHYIVDKIQEGFPLVLNAGSASHLPGGSFYVLDLSPENCFCKRFSFENKESKNPWSLQEERLFR